MVFHKHIHIIIILFFSINLFGQDESYNAHNPHSTTGAQPELTSQGV